MLPLMVLQVPNTPDPNDIGSALDTIFRAMAGFAGEHAWPMSSANTPHKLSAVLRALHPA